MAPPFREVEFDIMYGDGISSEGSLVDLGVDENIIEKSGAWYSFDGTRIGQGRENVKDFLKENKDMAAEIEKRLREKFGLAKTRSAHEQEKQGVPDVSEASQAPGKRAKKS
jgi:recombination protein RecA